MSKDAKDPIVDLKLEAFKQVAEALKPLNKAEQYAVLHAAAQFFGCTIKGTV